MSLWLSMSRFVLLDGGEVSGKQIMPLVLPEALHSSLVGVQSLGNNELDEEHCLLVVGGVSNALGVMLAPSESALNKWSVFRELLSRPLSAHYF
jgi:hypothetical protein